MCMQCVGIVGTGFQAAALIGGPIVIKHYQRVRAAFGLPDNSVAAVEARAAAEAAGGLCPEATPAPIARGRRDHRRRTASGPGGRTLPGGAVPGGA